MPESIRELPLPPLMVGPGIERARRLGLPPRAESGDWPKRLLLLPFLVPLVVSLGMLLIPGMLVLVVAGQPLRGRLLIDAPESLPISGVERALGWRTSGRGVSDHREVQSLRLLEDGVLERSRVCPFTMNVPAAPLSRSEGLVRIGRWLEGTIRRSRAANIQQRWSIHVA